MDSKRNDSDLFGSGRWVGYKSAFVSNGVYPTGISFNSICKHKNSPPTHINVAHTAFNSHHEKFDGNDPL